MRAAFLPNQEAEVRRIALEEGVDPDVLVSIWRQESSGGTDPTLKHPAIQSGPRSGEYARGPFGIMSFHGAIPNDFEGQARWAAKHLKERGVRGYYGTGKAPAGYPSTDEYEQQVMARAGKPLQVAQAGRADIMPGLLSQRQAPSMAAGESEMPNQDFIGGLLDDPRFLMGASILASKDVGKGLLGGAVAAENMKMRKLQIEMMRRKQEEAAQQQQMQQRFMQLVAQGISPEAALQGAATGDLGALGVMGSLMGIEGAGKLVDYSNARLPYGQMTQADKANTGIREREARLKEAEAAYGGIVPAEPGQGTGMASPGITPKARNAGTEEYLRKRAADEADAVKAASASARTAYSQNQSLKRFLAASPEALSGSGAPVLNAVKNFLTTWGYRDDQLKSAQDMQQAVAEMKAARMAELGARGLTDKDMEILTQSLPRIEVDPRARVAVARVLTKSNDSAINEFSSMLDAEEETYRRKAYRPRWLGDWKPTVFEDIEENAPAAPVMAPPAIGTVKNGWRFKGGNPADKANWEQVQGGF